MIKLFWFAFLLCFSSTSEIAFAKVICNSKSANTNIRSMPGVKGSEIVASIPNGTKIEYIETHRNVENTHDWVKLNATVGGRKISGFAAKDFVQDSCGAHGDNVEKRNDVDSLQIYSISSMIGDERTGWIVDYHVKENAPCELELFEKSAIISLDNHLIIQDVQKNLNLNEIKSVDLFRG